MAHNLNLNKLTNVHTFYSRKQIAWHGLGKVVQEDHLSHEVLQESQLDFLVEKCPVYAKFPNETSFLDDNGNRKKGEIVPNLHATVRMDTGDILGHCSDRYEVVQNRDAFAFIDNIVGEKLAIYETAGALGKGETVFVTAKLPDYIKPTDNKDDIIEKYIIFTTSHDGTGSVRAMFSPIRVVCNNTLNMALRSCSNKVVFKHTKNIQNKLKEARGLMGLYIDYSKKLTMDLAHMASFTVNDKQIDRVIAEVFLSSEQLATFNINGNILLDRELPKKTSNQLITVKDFIQEGSGQMYSRGTAYWLYNGITDYVNNGKDYSSDEDRMTSLVDGWGQRIAQTAYNKVNELILI